MNGSRWRAVKSRIGTGQKMMKMVNSWNSSNLNRLPSPLFSSRRNFGSSLWWWCCYGEHFSRRLCCSVLNNLKLQSSSTECWWKATQHFTRLKSSAWLMLFSILIPAWELSAQLLLTAQIAENRWQQRTKSRTRCGQRRFTNWHLFTCDAQEHHHRSPFDGTHNKQTVQNKQVSVFEKNWSRSSCVWCLVFGVLVFGGGELDSTNWRRFHLHTSDSLTSRHIHQVLNHFQCNVFPLKTFPHCGWEKWQCFNTRRH